MGYFEGVIHFKIPQEDEGAYHEIRDAIEDGAVDIAVELCKVAFDMENPTLEDARESGIIQDVGTPSWVE